MSAIPLPFVIALLLAVLLLRLVMLREPTLRPAVGFVAACIAVAAIVGARWTFDWPVVRFLQPVLASGLPPIAWLCFTAGQDKNRWLHALPPALVLVLSALWPLWRSPVDLVLALLYFGYGAALLRLAPTGPDSFVTTRLSDVAAVHKATLAAGALLITSAFVDLLIAVDFGFYQGTHAAWIVTAGNLLVLPVLAYLVAVIGRSIPPEDAGYGPKPTVSNEEDQRILDAVDRLMREKQLFRDPDLTLNRIARRAGIPARQISGAINRLQGRNVSQLVNGYRIEAAKHLLSETEMPVTTVMFEAGFQTKSNFNREFLRTAGCSPSDFRRATTAG
jgi:AraC-like DNA-binding protein